MRIYNGTRDVRDLSGWRRFPDYPRHRGPGADITELFLATTERPSYGVENQLVFDMIFGQKAEKINTNFFYFLKFPNIRASSDTRIRNGS